MLGQNTEQFDLSSIVISTFKFPWFKGKAICEIRKYANGKTRLVSYKTLAAEERQAAEMAAKQARQAEDAALANESNQKGYAEATAQILTAAETIIPDFVKTVNAAAKAAKAQVIKGQKIMKTGAEMVDEGKTNLTYTQILGSKVTLLPPAQSVK